MYASALSVELVIDVSEGKCNELYVSNILELLMVVMLSIAPHRWET
jgi:hypothetical protein